jgi:hypothetical protein
LDNPQFENATKSLADIRARKKWTEAHPVYRREYLGEWVHNTESLVYAWNRDRNGVQSAPPPSELTCILSNDLGTSEDKPSTAFVVLGYGKGKVWVLESAKFAGLTPTDIAERILALSATYKFTKVIVDPGFLGAAYIKEFRLRHQIPAFAAEKHAKSAYIELCNGEITSGLVQFVTASNEALLGELEVLQWNQERTNTDDRFADHLADAFRYGWRACRHFLQRAETPGPEPGSPEWEELEQDLYFDRMARRHELARRYWWRGGSV